MLAALPDSPHTQQFCEGVVADGGPIVVRCRPVPRRPTNECFRIVDEYVEENGGERIIGWAIWERPGIFIEAELHAVWRSADGELIDITPRIFPFDSITFLPAPSKKYAGLQVDNIRHPLIKDNDVTRYLYLFKRRFEIMNTGDLAEQYGEIALPRRLHKEYVKLIKEIEVLQNRIDKKYPFHPIRI